jgi:hypothetical protein
MYFPVVAEIDTVAKNSQPSWIVERIGRVIVSFAGALPLAKSVRGESCEWRHRKLIWGRKRVR